MADPGFARLAHVANETVERRALDELHRIKVRAALVARRIHRHDVGVMQQVSCESPKGRRAAFRLARLGFGLRFHFTGGTSRVPSTSLRIAKRSSSRPRISTAFVCESTSTRTRSMRSPLSFFLLL